MHPISIKYGSQTLELRLDAGRWQHLVPPPSRSPLDDAAINRALDQPLDTPAPEDIVGDGQTVLIVVPDATRETGAGQIVNLLIRRLIAGGTAAYNIAIIFATGIHRRVTETEKQNIVTPFIAQRIMMIDHDARDLMRSVRYGQIAADTGDTIDVELSRSISEYDHVFLVGGVSFHYFAGFTGGRKLICPGLASSRTIAATHRLAFDPEIRDRTIGVGPGRLDGNRVHRSFVDAAAFARASFAVNTIVGDGGSVTDVFCGDQITSHERACKEFAQRYTVVINERRDVVVAGCGGWPYDVNLIQAHKSLDAAAAACSPGGTIILFAECREGLGNESMRKWFELGSAEAMADRLCSKYETNGQTAWAFRRKAEMFDVRMVTDLDDEHLKLIGAKRAMPSDAERLSVDGYVIPSAAKLLIKTEPV